MHGNGGKQIVMLKTKPNLPGRYGATLIIAPKIGRPTCRLPSIYTPEAASIFMYLADILNNLQQIHPEFDNFSFLTLLLEKIQINPYNLTIF